ncbi:MAG: hypothetical protein M0011_11505 [Elusimicrobia bacterium]|nr:hypothetical protein [Elusimicrobiota bacterium]
MRILIAMLMMAATASPLMAQDLSADATLNALVKQTDGNQGLVQEYTKQDGTFKVGSVGFNAAATGAKTYLNVSAAGLGSGEESGELSLNMGTLAIKASENTMYHRQPYIKTGMIANGTFYINTNEKITDDRWNNGKYNTANVMDESFKRTESDMSVSYTCPKTGDYSMHVGQWEEKENGDAATKSSGKVMQTYVDRSHKLLDLGFDAKLGDHGAVAYDYTQGSFSDDAAGVLISTTASFYWQKAKAPAFRMDMHGLAFRSQPLKGYSVTGSVMSRTREALVSGYKMGSYTATLGAAHRFGEKLAVTVKGYGRTETITENDNFWFMNSVKNSIPSSTKQGETSQPDKTNFTGEFMAKYDLSDKLGFSLGYKLDHNYNRHAGTEIFTASQTYIDGGYVAANTQYNEFARKSTKNIYTAGANIRLPMDAELGLGYKAVRANKAMFESLPTTSDEYNADFYMPIKGSLSFIGSAMAMNGKNEKSNHTNSNDHQNSYLAGLEWNNEKYNAGANYAFDQTSSHSDAYYAGYSPWGAAYVVTNPPVRVLGELYQYKNDTIGLHASAKLGSECVLMGDSSYTRSLAKSPVLINFADGYVTDTEPSDIRMVNSGLNLKYSPKGKNLSADLGVRRAQWNDKLNSENSGWVNSASLSLSTKF